jgi:hypothetical protein
MKDRKYRVQSSLFRSLCPRQRVTGKNHCCHFLSLNVGLTNIRIFAPIPAQPSTIRLQERNAYNLSVIDIENSHKCYRTLTSCLLAYFRVGVICIVFLSPPLGWWRMKGGEGGQVSSFVSAAGILRPQRQWAEGITNGQRNTTTTRQTHM